MTAADLLSEPIVEQAPPPQQFAADVLDAPVPQEREPEVFAADVLDELEEVSDAEGAPDLGDALHFGHEYDSDPPGEDEIVGNDIPADVAFDIEMAMHPKEVVAEERPEVQHEETAVDVLYSLPEIVDCSPVEEVPSDIAFDVAVVGESERIPQEAVHEMPAFNDFIDKRIAAQLPKLLERPSLEGDLRQLSIDFGPVWAPAGFRTTIKISPQVLFRGEKIAATDTSASPGSGTRILSVAIGQKIQKAGGDNGTLTSMFAATALANGITFDTAHKWAQIAVTVSFVQSCTFDMSIFGSAVL